jgi:hypothetical protein
MFLNRWYIFCRRCFILRTTTCSDGFVGLHSFDRIWSKGWWHWSRSRELVIQLRRSSSILVCASAIKKGVRHLPGQGGIKFMPAEAIGTIDRMKASSYLFRSMRLSWHKNVAGQRKYTKWNVYKDLGDPIGAGSKHTLCASCRRRPSSQKK